MEKNYNEIDDFFKKSFEQEGTSDEGWNVPSEEVWARLSESESERKPVFMYWRWAAVAAGLLLFFLVGQSIYHQNQLQQQAEKIEQLERQLKKQTIEQSKGLTLDADKDIKQSQVDSSTILVKKEPLKEKTIISYTPQNDLISPVKGISKVASIEQEIIVTNDTIQENNTSLSNPLLLTKTTNLLNSTTKQLAITPPSLSIPKLTNKKSTPSQLTINYAIAESAQSFDNRRIPMLRSNVIKEQNLNLGLRYTHSLNKNWFIESGVHFSKSVAERRHLLRSRFQRNNERPGGNDNFESTHNLSLSSSAYDLDTDIVLSRSSGSTNIFEGQNLRLIGIVNNEIQRLSIPVLLGYQLKYQRWNWTMKAGFMPTIKIIDQVRLDRILSSESEFMVQAVTRTQRRSNPNTPSTDWHFYAGTSLSYQFNDTWALQLEPYFSRSLSPTTMVRGSDIFNHSTGIHLGLRYTL